MPLSELEKPVKTDHITSSGEYRAIVLVVVALRKARESGLVGSRMTVRKAHPESLRSERTNTTANISNKDRQVVQNLPGQYISGLSFSFGR
jgi:hypothetical protein